MDAGSGFTPTSGILDGSQAAVFLTSEAGVYQDLNATYEPGFRYAFTVYMANSLAVVVEDLVGLQFRDTGNRVAAQFDVTR